MGVKERNLRENLLRTGMGCFAFFAGITLLNVLLLPFARAYHGYGIRTVLFAFMLALAAYGAAALLLRRTDEERLEHIRKAAVPVCVAALFVMQIILGYLMEYRPAGDNFMVYDGAALLASDGCFDQEPGFELYLARFSNQWGLLLFFSAMWKFFFPLGVKSIFMPMVIVQAALYIPGVLCALSIARKKGGVRAELMLLILLVTCLPIFLAGGGTVHGHVQPAVCDDDAVFCAARA